MSTLTLLIQTRLRTLTLLALLLLPFVGLVHRYGANVVLAQEATLSDERFDRTVWLLKRATKPRSDGSHLRLLRALRQMKDTSLHPFFSSLSLHDNPPIRINAILGLAEISENGHINPWKISQLERVEYRRGAFAEAVSQKLIGVDELREILTWSDLDDATKSVILFLLVSDNEQVDHDMLHHLMTEGDSPVVQARSALALMQLGIQERTEEALAGLERLPISVRDDTIANLLHSIRNHDLNQTEPWVSSLLVTDESLPAALQFEVVYTLLHLNPAIGFPQWSHVYDSSTSIAHQIRYALMLISEAPNLPANAFEQIKSSSLSAMVQLALAGEAITAGSPGTEECLALIREHHALSSAWVLDYTLNTLPEGNVTASSAILAALIDDTLQDGPVMNERLDLAVIAAENLIHINPERLHLSLNEARRKQRRLTEEAILTGILRSDDPLGIDFVSNVDRWSSTRAGSLAIMIAANVSDPGSLSSDDLYRLSLVFGGAGRVSTGMQIQAAWWYLKHTEQQGQALAAVLGDLAESSP